MSLQAVIAMKSGLETTATTAASGQLVPLQQQRKGACTTFASFFASRRLPWDVLSSLLLLLCAVLQLRLLLEAAAGCTSSSSGSFPGASSWFQGALPDAQAAPRPSQAAHVHTTVPTSLHSSHQ